MKTTEQLDNCSKNEKNALQPSTLYLVSTPIGNMSDLSPRGIKILSEVDLIAAEDTRNTQKLLNMLGIKNKTISYFEHNKTEKGKLLIDYLLSGMTIALVSDAGTPAISDPGQDIVKLCYENNIQVTSVPGCCAAINALILSGLDTRRFTFEGFLPFAKKERREKLAQISRLPYTIILYEAPHKLLATLTDLCEHFSQRRIALCREMTKLNEEIIRTTVFEAKELFTQKAPKGEFVLVLEGYNEDENISVQSEISIEEEFELYTSEGLSKMDAIKQIAKKRNIKKSEVYSIICK